MAKIPFKIMAFLGYAVSFALSLVCYIIYAYLPESDSFTNSPDYSGAETVRIFGSSAVAGLLSLIVFLIVAFVYRKYFYKLTVEQKNIGKICLSNAAAEWISVISTLIVAAVLFTSTLLSFLYFNECITMKYPFLAPTDNTVFETYEYVILANCIVYFVFFILTGIKMAGINWLDAIVRFTGRAKAKIKNK